VDSIGVKRGSMSVGSNGMGDVVRTRKAHEAIKLKFDTMRLNAQAIDQFAVQAKLVTTDKKEKELSRKVGELIDENMSLARSIKGQLDEMKQHIEQQQRLHDEDESKGAASSSTTLQIHRNLWETSCRRFREAMAAHHDATNTFTDVLKQRTHRQILIVDPSISREKADELIENGTATEFLQQKIISPNVLAVVEEIESRHLQMRKLEHDVAELLQLFQDLALLVDQQQEVLDSIQHHIERSEDHVTRAERDLGEAAKHQNKARKTKFAIGATLAALLAVVIGPSAAVIAPAL